MYKFLKLSSKKDLYYLIALSLIILAVFYISMNFPFLEIFDDDGYVINNKHIESSFLNIKYWFTNINTSNYIPITMLSYIFDHTVWTYNSFGYHLQNIFWHIVTVIAIYKCFRLFNIKSWITFLLCLIFAAHPQRVESVVWISERKDLLCGAFYFWSIYFYIKNVNKTFSIISFILFIMAMLSKPMAISLPIVLLLYEFYRRGKSKDCILKTEDQRLKTGDEKRGLWSGVRNPSSVTQNLKSKIQHLVVFRIFCAFRGCFSSLWSTVSGLLSIYRLWPYFLILIIFIPISIIAQGSTAHSYDQTFSSGRLYTILYNVYWYFSQTIFPTEQNPLYPSQVFLNNFIELILFYSGSILVVIIILRKNSFFLIYTILPIILAFIISLLPVVGLIRLGSITRADRYSYIPSVFIWFSVGLVFTMFLYSKKYISNKSRQEGNTTLLLKRKFIFLILFLYLIVLIVLNVQYQSKWENNYTLFTYASNYTPAHNIVLIALADTELKRANYRNLHKIVKKLKLNKSVLATFYEASVINQFNKKKSIKLFLEIKPMLEAISEKNQDWNFYYPRTLKMLISSYGIIGEQSKMLEYIKEHSKYTKITITKSYKNKYFQY